MQGAAGGCGGRGGGTSRVAGRYQDIFIATYTPAYLLTPPPLCLTSHLRPSTTPPRPMQFIDAMEGASGPNAGGAQLPPQVGLARIVCGKPKPPHSPLEMTVYSIFAS